ncbi:MAG: hypothetical protein VXW11_08660, partial [Pseudomonadota bacterium]|nr:hypothetical protein [Pseudomonadota bacterium]
MFTLDHRLENDSEFIADWGVFSLRQMKDERFFWLLIIPRLPAISEWHDLSAADLAELNKLISYLSYHIKQIEKADKIILPGVGSFDQCMNRIRKIKDLLETLKDQVITKKKPFLGICVGM